MKKRSENPFGDSELPPRGTGLETGTAGERRAGNPRTDVERVERHKEVMNDSTGVSEYIMMETDGAVHFRKKGYESAVIPAVEKPALKDAWAAHRAKKSVK